MSEFAFLHVVDEGDVVRIELDRAPVNAIDQDMYLEIEQLFGSFRGRFSSAKVAVLTGRGKHFCAGNDLPEFQSMTPANGALRMRRVWRAFHAIYSTPVPVIAAVQGAALGTGLGIAMSCDIIIASESAKFGLPEVNVGLMGGARHAARFLPEQVVRAMYFTAEPLTAHECMGHGAVFKVVPDDRLGDEASALASSIARHSPVTLRFAKKSLNAVEELDLWEGYAKEQTLSVELSGSADAKEAVTAQIERRTPVYAEFVDVGEI